MLQTRGRFRPGGATQGGRVLQTLGVNTQHAVCKSWGPIAFEKSLVRRATLTAAESARCHGAGRGTGAPHKQTPKNKIA